MPTIKVKQDVEATPADAVEHLRAFAKSEMGRQVAKAFLDQIAATVFPHKIGTLVEFTPAHATALKAMPEFYGLIIARPLGSPLACAAYFTEAGEIRSATITPNQISGVVVLDPPDAADGKAGIDNDGGEL